MFFITASAGCLSYFLTHNDQLQQPKALCQTSKTEQRPASTMPTHAHGVTANRSVAGKTSKFCSKTFNPLFATLHVLKRPPKVPIFLQILRVNLNVFVKQVISFDQIKVCPFKVSDLTI